MTRNRAKCRLCKSIIESLHQYDEVECNCGEISITGGNYELKCRARNFSNFMRLDDRDNEILVKILEEEPIEPKEPLPAPSREELIKFLDEMIQGYDNLPAAALNQPITIYDLHTFMLLVSAILKHPS